MKVLAITQARYGSTRLPGKVNMNIGNKTMLAIHLERILKSKYITQLIVATTKEKEAHKIINIADQCGVSCYQGSTEDVLDRFYQAAILYNPDWVVRLTSDCPLIDAELIDEVIEQTVASGADYGSNVFESSYPDGQDVEVFTFASLKKAWMEAKLISQREHVTSFIMDNTDLEKGQLFKGYGLNSNTDYSNIRMTVDEPEDLELIRTLVSKLGDDKSWLEYTEYIINQNLSKFNAHFERNEGYLKSLKNDKT